MMLRIFFLAALCALAAWPQTAAHPDVTGALGLLETWVARQVAERELPGVAIGIVHGDALIWSKGFGYADMERKTPITPKTQFRMASHTKVFTATALLQLRDAGKLQLDDPVSKYLPWFAVQGLPAEGPAVTIRHLITHSSGLPREAPGTLWTETSFPALEEVMRELPRQDTVFPPETRWKYSNLAFTLAGLIVEKVSGEPYAGYVQKHILAPLGMSDSRITGSTPEPALATPYRRREPGKDRETAPFTDCRAIAPAAALTSTVEDMARFVAFQWKGGRVLKMPTLREMQRPHWVHPDWKSGWGLGFALRRDDDRLLAGHGGSVPGYRTQTWFSPAEQIGVVVLTNADDGNPAQFADQAIKLVFPVIRRTAAKPEPPGVPDPAWNRYTGTYQSPSSEFVIQISGSRLVMFDPSAPDVEPSVMRLVPVRPHVFRMESDRFTYGAIGELIQFELDANGRVTRARTPGGYAVRANQ
ncbi:MAG: serine hydrolase [Bryobacterales bacterium]|nr:serine hydrolase [Bryobacterales bacterium]